MATISRWVIPCYCTEGKHKTEPITLDLTSHLKEMLLNKVWERKYTYGFSNGLQATIPSNIKCAEVKIFPRFISGSVNDRRIPQLIEEHCGKLPSHLKIKNYKDWSHHLGFVIIEVEYLNKVAGIPSKKDLTEDIIPHYNREFIQTYHQHLAVLKEIVSFFLAGLHLTFPTESFMMINKNPINDGYFQIASGKKTYACKVASNAFMHEVLIETSKISNLEINLKGLSSIWHLNLWPLNRYLRAVESDQTSVDNLLDLIYSIEGLFDKSTSAEFIKTMCLLQLCTNKRKAKGMKNLLDLAYKMRNDITHGGLSYDPYDKVMLEGKEILAQTVYWKIKSITAAMLVKAISKLISNKDMKNLRFNTDDFINLSFKQ
jgi:hypothetical protein